MKDKQYTEYISPECKLIVVEASGMILIGSNEGGGGNESYAPLPEWDPFGDINPLGPSSFPF